MSGFGGNQFEGEDKGLSVEQQLQEELRKRRMASASQVNTPLGFGGRPHPEQAFMSSLIAAENAANPGAAANPYYAQQQRAAAAHAAASAASPFGRSPYGGGGYGHNPNDAALAASLYGRPPPRGPYGYGDQRFHGYGIPSSHDIYSQHFGRTAQEMSIIDRAAAYNAQQRQAEQQNMALLQAQSSGDYNPTAGEGGAQSISASTLSYMQKGTPKIPSPDSGAKALHWPGQQSQPGLGSPNTSTHQHSMHTPGHGQPLMHHSPEKMAGTPNSNGSNLISMHKDSMLAGSMANKHDEMAMSSGDANRKWFSGCVPLGLDDDKYWLSELQVYLRSNFAEAFGATEEDIAAPMHGRNKPIALGQVGIRCKHCKHENPAERGQQATSYPSLISGVYNSVQQMLRLHLDCCQAMPQEVRAKIEQLKLSSSSRGGRKQYWIDSAKRLGLVDTPHGIHFGRDPSGPLPPLTGPSVNSKESRKKKETQHRDDGAGGMDDDGEVLMSIPQVEERPLVFAEDKPLISDVLHLTLEQMSPCILTEADKVGCYKTRDVGFPGLACKHCVGQAGCGRYFPASEASLSQTTTSQTIMNHVRNCRRCPPDIRENLELMKRARMGPDGKRADKPKHGGRKVFFHRLWCRIQGIPMEDGKGETKEQKKKKKPKASPPKKQAKKKAPAHEYDSEAEENEEPPPEASAHASEEETETESSADEASDNEGSDKKAASKPKPKSSSPEKQVSPWFEGCVRLTKTDDPHWLSEVQCFARSELVELFTLKEGDDITGYSGRKEPAIGQVGIRCIFCKSLDPDERRDGCVTFPESLESIHTKVGDMLRLHFQSCPAMPDTTKEMLKSQKGLSQKVADDTQQYWVDAASDIGLSPIPPGGANTGWGITFRRDPLQPSPSDDLDHEGNNPSPSNLGKAFLVRDEDRPTCTDQMMLMMRQVKACTFQKRDRRVGQRNRDRAIGYPGFACIHCASKNNAGRYFPVSPKNLTDNTANSLLAHVSSCSRCPEPIKASLAYLGHRGILQKTALSGSWKKGFFKKVWDRLHQERAWSAEGGENDELEEDGSQSGGESGENEDDNSPPAAAAANDEESGDGESGAEEGGEQMNALIKAAAIWLTEQDQDGPSRTRGGRGRGLPSGNKRSTTSSPKGKGRGGNSSSAKKRKVHF